MTRASGRTPLVALLLFGSGCAALVYQTVWLRELRLIFGSSTAATAAVTAVFMSGLGFGSLLLGRRVELRKLGVAFYGRLELVIAVSAALSLLLIKLTATIYFATGGSFAMGHAAATIVRLIATFAVLAVPTFLMGGTLPAAARGVEHEGDRRRSSTALLYGANTLGAVTGATLSTFFLLEHLGNRGTLFAAVGLNLVVALIAMRLGDRPETANDAPVADEQREEVAPAASGRFVLIAAAVVGFAFLLMEIVWYRMLAPLLGGSTFTYGLILAVALLGIGVGGLLYSAVPGTRRPTLGGFAATSALEALALVVPLALGDRIAIVAALLRSLDTIGFAGEIAAWTAVCAMVVLPASVIAGIQFPLLIGLLGSGRSGVGNDIGRAYAWNTAGAIAGSIVGGFGILPLLSAPGAWKLAAVILAMLALTSCIVAWRVEPWRAAGSIAVVVAVFILTFRTVGPTAVWRHQPIGAGRVKIAGFSANALRKWMHDASRDVFWEEDGRESSVAVTRHNGYAFFVNGKSDGSVIGDAGTQIMAPMIGAMIHPRATSSLVVGLGTGSSAGWLGAVPWMERVDVVELEPAVRHVAKLCAAGNANVLGNRKVHVELGDAREYLLTTDKRYSLIFSEPSNPYRAGIASLFTREFYEAARERLDPGGLFLQWVQLYEVDAATIETIYATLATVFPHVQTWVTLEGDLLLLGAERPVTIDATMLRTRMASEPFASAARMGWGARDAESFLAHFVAGDRFTRATNSASTAPINTDDRNGVEFGLAKMVGRVGEFSAHDLRAAARRMGDDLPPIAGKVDVSRIRAVRVANRTVGARCGAESTEEENAVCRITDLFHAEEYDQVIAAFGALKRAPQSHDELVMLAASAARAGHTLAPAMASALTKVSEAEGSIVNARWLIQQQQYDAATPHLLKAIELVRRDPFIAPALMDDLFASVERLGMSSADRRELAAVATALQQPFALEARHHRRLGSLFVLAQALANGGCTPAVAAVVHQYEPYVPWEKPFLTVRARCYEATGDPLARPAAEDLALFRRQEPRALSLQSSLP